MEESLISLAVITLIAAITPLLAKLVPHKLVPETVFLLFAGAICGPHLLDLIHLTEPISLLSDLGLAFLFLLAGYEINPKNLSNYSGKRGLATWLFTFGLALVVVWLWPAFSLSGIDGLAVVIALTTTALGTLLPILRERKLLDTPIGDAILSYGTWGELCPVIAMALLLSTRTTIQSVIILVIFAAVAVGVAITFSRLKSRDKVELFLREGAQTTQQTMVRAVVLLMVGLTALSAVFNLDIVLGSFAAGFILRYVIAEGSKSLERKLDGLAFGFFIPLFFIVSGANIDLTAVGQRPDLLVFFVLLLLLIRALPIFIALSTGKHRHDLSRSSRITVALYCTTALPVIVAVTTVAQQSGTMSSEIASVLVCAGAITVLVMPALASATTRISDTQPVQLAKDISASPSSFSEIVKNRAELVRNLAKARAFIEKDDPDLAERITPLVQKMMAETTPDDADVRYFIGEVTDRYNQLYGSDRSTAASADEGRALAGEPASLDASENADGPSDAVEEAGEKASERTGEPNTTRNAARKSAGAADTTGNVANDSNAATGARGSESNDNGSAASDAREDSYLEVIAKGEDASTTNRGEDA